MNIATGIAKGLGYLHHTANPCFILRNLNSESISLSSEFESKICDFASVSLGPPLNKSSKASDALCTEGYIAPEYNPDDIPTFALDVYSFGVLLLEIITGQKAYDEARGAEKEHLVDWVRPYILQEKFDDLADPRLDGKYSGYILKSIINLVVLECLKEASSRPQMMEVADCLVYLTAEAYDANGIPRKRLLLMRPTSGESTEEVVEIIGERAEEVVESIGGRAEEIVEESIGERAEEIVEESIGERAEDVVEENIGERAEERTNCCQLVVKLVKVIFGLNFFGKWSIF